MFIRLITRESSRLTRRRHYDNVIVVGRVVERPSLRDGFVEEIRERRDGHSKAYTTGTFSPEPTPERHRTRTENAQ